MFQLFTFNQKNCHAYVQIIIFLCHVIMGFIRYSTEYSRQRTTGQVLFFCSFVRNETLLTIGVIFKYKWYINVIWIAINADDSFRWFRGVEYLILFLAWIKDDPKVTSSFPGEFYVSYIFSWWLYPFLWHTTHEVVRCNINLRLPEMK